MLLRLNKLYFDILQASRDLEQFTQGKSFVDFDNDRLLQVAVERCFEIIGEAVARLAREFPEEAEEIPNFRRIIGLRNILAHGYDVVDHRVLWDTLHAEIAPLIKLVEGKIS